MNTMRLFFLALTAAAFLQPAAAHNPDYSHDSCSGLFPDGSPIPEWFSDTASVAAGRKIKEYRLTDYNIFPDGRLHTTEIQALIDYAAAIDCSLPESHVRGLVTRNVRLTLVK